MSCMYKINYSILLYLKFYVRLSVIPTVNLKCTEKEKRIKKSWIENYAKRKFKSSREMYILRQEFPPLRLCFSCDIFSGTIYTLHIKFDERKYPANIKCESWKNSQLQQNLIWTCVKKKKFKLLILSFNIIFFFF